MGVPTSIDRAAQQRKSHAVHVRAITDRPIAGKSTVPYEIPTVGVSFSARTRGRLAGTLRVPLATRTALTRDTRTSAQSSTKDMSAYFPSPSNVREWRGRGGNGAQWPAGIGEYIYNEKGYRTIATIGEDYSFVYTQVFGLVLEFCGLAGVVTERLWVPLGTKDFASIGAPGREVPECRKSGAAPFRSCMECIASRSGPGPFFCRDRVPATGAGLPAAGSTAAPRGPAWHSDTKCSPKWAAEHAPVTPLPDNGIALRSGRTGRCHSFRCVRLQWFAVATSCGFG